MLRPGDLWRTLDMWEGKSAPGKGTEWEQSTFKKTENLSGENEKAFLVWIEVWCVSNFILFSNDPELCNT